MAIHRKQLEERVIEVLQAIHDPEIPVDIYQLGLVYGVEVDDGGRVTVTMTLTSPSCPVAGSLLKEVEARAGCALQVVTASSVELVWEPSWTPDRMTEAAKLVLGLL